MSKKRVFFSLVACSALVLTMNGPVTAGQTQDEILLQMQKLIEEQQTRLDSQARELAQLKEQMAALSGKTEDNSQKIAKTEETDLAKRVSSSSSNVNVKLYGHVNRAFLMADDGNSTRGYFVDNNNASTRWGLKARGKVNKNFSLGAWLEGEMITNNSLSVNQLEADPDSTNWHKSRHLEIDLASKQFGTLWLGRGFTASDSTSEADLSGTTVASFARIEAPAGGYYFYNNKSGLSNVKISAVFNDLDGLSRQDRVRYDTPSFAGLMFSTSAMSDAYDAAVRYSREFSMLKLSSALAWAKPGDIIKGVDNQYNGSLSILMNCGFNATFAAGIRKQEDNTRDDSSFWYAKLGYSASLLDSGKTSFSTDYGEYYDIAMNNDTGKTFSLALVQAVKDWGTDFYITFRQYQLERDMTDFEDINILLTGARVKF